MRIIRRVVIGLLVVALGLVGFGVLGTFVPLPLAQAADADARDRRILLVSNTIHTDIAIPVDAESLSRFGFLAEAGLPITHSNARWLLMGWGGRSFYMETPTLADIKPGPAFRALTLDSSVMHVDVLGEIEPGNPSVLELEISEAGYASLLAAIDGSFTRKGGQPLPIEGYAFGPTDRFFEAEGGFNALLGCNVWTSRMLRSAGLATGIWNPIPPSLTTSLALFNRPHLVAGGM